MKKLILLLVLTVLSASFTSCDNVEDLPENQTSTELFKADVETLLADLGSKGISIINVVDAPKDYVMPKAGGGVYCSGYTASGLWYIVFNSGGTDYLLVSNLQGGTSIGELGAGNTGEGICAQIF